MISARRFRRALALLTAGLLAGSLATTGSAYAAGPTGGVVVQPSDSQGNPLSGPGYFEVTAAPGSSLQLYALVGNVGQKQTTIRLAAVDATSGLYGGVSYKLPQQKRKLVGAWITLSTAKVTVRPGKGTLVPFAVHVPARIASGQYIGGLTAFAPISSQNKGTVRRRATSFQVQLRRVVAVVVTVPGPVVHRFSVGQVGPVRQPTGYYIVAQIKNSGNSLLAGQGNVWVWRQGQHKPVIFTHLSVDTTVPHTTVGYPVRWTKQPPRGQYRYRVMVWWNGGKTVRDGAFSVK